MSLLSGIGNFLRKELGGQPAQAAAPSNPTPAPSGPNPISVPNSTPAPQIRLNSAPDPRSLLLPNGQQANFAPPQQNSWNTPPPHLSLLRNVENYGKGMVQQAVNPISQFGNDVAALGHVVTGNIPAAQRVLQPGAGLGHQGGLLAGHELNPNRGIFVGPGSVQNIKTVAGQAAQTGSNLAPMGGGFAGNIAERIAKNAAVGAGVGAVGSVGSQLATTGKINPKKVAENATLTAAMGGAAPIAGAATRQFKGAGEEGFLGLGKPDNVFYQGSGRKMSKAAAGNDSLGKAQYVARDQGTAGQFGKVQQVETNLKPEEIFHINSPDQYQALVDQSLRKYKGEDPSTAIPKLITSSGYRAAEISKSADPLGGLAIYDPKAIVKVGEVPPAHNEIGAVGDNVLEPEEKPKLQKQAEPKQPEITNLDRVMANTLGTTPEQQAAERIAKAAKEPPMADEIKPKKPNLNEGAFSKEDRKFLNKANDMDALGQGKLAPEEYAQKYKVTPLQAQEDFENMAKEARNNRNISQADLERFGGKPLTIRERREIIANKPEQQPFNQVDMRVPEGNDEGAIAQATGIMAERDARFNDAIRLGNKLSKNDKELLYRYDNGESIDKLAKEADNPEAFDRAANSTVDALDYSLAADRTAGGTTLRQSSYIPHYYQASKDQMDELGIPENMRIKEGKEYRGYRDDSAKYRSYIEAKQKAGLSPLFDNPFDAIKEYGDKGRFKIGMQLLKTGLAQSSPDDIGTLGTVRIGENPLKQAAGKLPFAVTDRLNKKLAAFKDAYQPKTLAGKSALKIATGGNKVLKKSLFALTPFHYANEEAAFAGTTVFTHPAIFVKGNARALFSQVGGYNHIVNAARQDGTLDWARLSGLPIKEIPANIRLGKLNVLAQANVKLTQFGNTLMLEMARWAKSHDIDPRSPLGVQVAAEYGKVVGSINEAVQGIDPNMSKVFSQGALAPYWLRTRLGLVKDAVKYSTVQPTASRGIGLGNPGDIARSAVIGERALEAAIAVIGSAIATGALPTMKQLVNESGLNPSNPVPNIAGNGKNKKGERWVQELPTDPAGLAATAVTDPQHFASSRYAPMLSATTRFASNKDWNGLPLADPNAPNFLLKRTEGAVKGFLPISLQNATNPNISIKQGALEDVGLRYKVDPNDPQAQANKNYFNQYQQVSNGLKTSGPYGQYWAQQFNNLHPQNTTDAAGNKYPVPYNPTSSEQKYAAYTTVDQNGRQVLSPVYFADQKLANVTPGYPSSPLYKLSGNGVDVTGQASPKALVAMQYQHAQDPAAKQDIMAANGGQGGWLAQYENQVGDYSKNYQQNLTGYFQKLGWTPNAINDYWSKHPSTADPIDQVNFDQKTQDTINQYYSLQSSGDSTAASQFFSQNANTLGPAFDQLAQHANALRSAKGELQLQGYPAESDHVKAVLSSMPAGADKASKIARAKLISGNSDVSQYLTDVSLYETLAKGAPFRYKLPASMGATEAQNINNGGQNGQVFMKNVSNLAKYGIGFNPTTGNYSIMQNGGFQPGSASSSAYAKSKKRPKMYLARTNLRSRHIKLRSVRKIKVAYPARPGRVHDEGKISKISLGGGVNDRSIRLV